MKVSGLAKLQRKIAAMPKAAKIEIRAALAQSAQEIVDTAKSFAPIKDGDLKKSITWQFGDLKRIAHSQAIAGSKANHELSARVTAGNGAVRYAHLVEFGTAPHKNGGKFAGSQHPGTIAQPFFYPAYRLGKKRAKSRISRAINRAAKKVAAS